MTDPNSPIIDFYPTDFDVDMNGKRFEWQGIAILPFIDEIRLLNEVEKIENTLTEKETRRNSRMNDMLFVPSSHKLSPYISALHDRTRELSAKERAEIKEQIKSEASGGMDGYISLPAGDPCPQIFGSPIEGMDDIKDNRVMCAIYKLPDPQQHIAHPPAGVKLPKKTVKLSDLKPAPALWHEGKGHKPQDNRRNSSYQPNRLNQYKNPPGSISGHQLADAARRLVINNLQVKTGNCQASGAGPSFVSPRSQDNEANKHPPCDTRKTHKHSNSSQGQHDTNPQSGQPCLSQVDGGNQHQSRVYQNGPVHPPHGSRGPKEAPSDTRPHQGGGSNSGGNSYGGMNHIAHEGKVWVPRESGLSKNQKRKAKAKALKEVEARTQDVVS